MTLTNAYLTLPEFKQLASITTVTGDADCERAIEAASRTIDGICGRRFYSDAAATARTYHAEAYWSVLVDDFHTTTDLVVKTDTGDDGTFETTWASTDYELLPRNGIMNGVEGWPYTTVRAVEGRTFPCGKRASVQVTAKWGWAAVPPAVEQACVIAALDFWKAKDAPFGIAGIEGDGTVARVRSNPQVRALLAPFMKGTGVGGVRVG